MQGNPVIDTLRQCLPVALQDPETRVLEVAPAGNGFSGLTYEVHVDLPRHDERHQALVVRLGRSDDPHAASSLAAQWRLLTTLARIIGTAHLQRPIWFGLVPSTRFSAALVLSFVPGKTLSAVPAGDDSAAFAAAGKALASLHHVGRPAWPKQVGTVRSWRSYVMDSLAEVRSREARWAEPDPVMRYVVARLQRRLPAELPLVLLHGDPNPDNVVLRSDTPAAALIDWERHRLGDPREDLGWLTYMQRLENLELGRPLPGLLEAYREASGLGVEELDELGVAYFALFSAVKLISAQRERAELRPPDPLLAAYGQGLSALDHRAWLDLCASLPA